MIVRSHNNWFEHPFTAFARGTPFGSLELLRRELDQVFSRERSSTPEPCFDCAMPQSTFTLQERDSELLLTAQVPGLTEKDLEITVTADRLTVRGERKVQAPEGYTKVRQERASYAFDRSFQLPKRIDSKRVEAKLADGTLTITLPKAEELEAHHVSVLSA